MIVRSFSSCVYYMCLHRPSPQLVAKVRVPTLDEAAKIGDRAIMSVVQVPFHTASAEKVFLADVDVVFYMPRAICLLCASSGLRHADASLCIGM